MWRKRLKKTSIILSIGILSLIIISILLAFLLEKPIANFVIKELNKSLKSEISVEKVNFSFLKKFPYATIELKNITAKDAISNFPKDTLLKAESIKLHFNLIALIRKEYHLKQLEISAATINIKVYKDQSDNFHFWKSSNSTQKKFNIDIKKIIFKELKINYKNYFLQQNCALLFQNLEAKGNFSEQFYAMKINTKFTINHIISNNITYIQNKEIELKTLFEVDNSKNNYIIKESSIKYSGIELTSAGNFVVKTNKNSVNMIVKGQNISFQSIQEQLPENIKKYLSEYEANAKLTFEIKVNGMFDGKISPLIVITLNCKNGNITEPKSKTKIDNIIFNACFTNHKSWLPDSSLLEIKNFSANIDKSYIESSFTINNFADPTIKAKLKANIDFPVLSNFIKTDSVQFLEGNANIALEFYSKINDINNIKPNDFMMSETKGYININKLKIKNNKHNQLYENISATLDFDKKEVKISSFKGNIKGSDFEIKGNIQNFFPYLLFPSEKLYVNAKLYSSNLNPDDLFIAQNYQTKSKKLALLDRIIALLQIELKQFVYKNFLASNMKADIAINANELIAQNVSFDAMDGKVEGYISFTNEKDKIIVRCMADIEKVDISKLFYSFNNFGQKNITSKHIKGIVKANIHYQSLFNSTLTIIPESILAKADLTIENGGLNYYKPLLALSKYVKVEELENVKFSTLKNSIEIKNQTVYFPEMEIKSTALNLQLAGNHTFSNEIDYRVKLLLSELLSNKVRKRNNDVNEFGIEQDDGLGRTTIFLHITGTVDNTQFKYDTKNAVKKVFSDLKKERQNLKNIFKKDSIQIKNQQQKLQEQGKFIIQWDENTPIEKDTLNSQKKQQKKSNVKIEWE